MKENCTQVPNECCHSVCVCVCVCVLYMCVLYMCVCSHVQSAAQLSVVPHLHIYSLIQTQPDQIQRLFNSIGGLLLKIKFQ